MLKVCLSLFFASVIFSRNFIVKTKDKSDEEPEKYSSKEIEYGSDYGEGEKKLKRRKKNYFSIFRLCECRIWQNGR